MCCVRVATEGPRVVLLEDSASEAAPPSHCGVSLLPPSSHSTAAAMKHSEASVLTVADLADLFTEDGEPLG